MPHANIEAMSKQSRRKRQNQWQVGISALIMLVGLTLCLAFSHIVWQKPPGEVDAFLVLGGSIQREIYAAQLVKQHPDTPVLISSGSDDPCILLIFQRSRSPIDSVWLERCAQSTFGNFYFALPILQRWNVRKVHLITSATHLPRAQWLAQIMLGSHDIWVNLETVSETGVPGNQENWLKTALDVVRAIVWAGISQVRTPPVCRDVMPLVDVNLERWQQRGFKCEYQGWVLR
jgi:uncharacterized SAM-binding protein YcdF (DUF218 family)